MPKVPLRKSSKKYPLFHHNLLLSKSSINFSKDSLLVYSLKWYFPLLKSYTIIVESRICLFILKKESIDSSSLMSKYPKIKSLLSIKYFCIALINLGREDNFFLSRLNIKIVFLILII